MGVSDVDSLSLEVEVEEDYVDEDCESEAEETVGVDGIGVRGKLGSKGVEDGTSFSNINGEGAVDMVLEVNPSDSRLHGISIPIVLEAQDSFDESKGVETAVRSECFINPSVVGPSVFKAPADVVIEKGRVASQRRRQRRKEFSDCVGQFDMVVKGLRPNVRRAHSMGEALLGLMDPWGVDSCHVSPQKHYPHVHDSVRMKKILSKWNSATDHK